MAFASLLTAALLSGHCAVAQGQQEAATPNAADTSQAAHKKSGLWGKLVANAQYQQAKQNGQSGSQFLPDDPAGGSKKKKPLCNLNDDGVSLQSDGSWAGPNCITSDGNGHAKHLEDVKDDKPKDSDDAKAKRAAEMETHSCMTTDGADKANELAADCKKVADHADKACNIQENSCDEIRKATQKGCWGKSAEGPDWCLTRYH